ncbi:hypothetical protein MRX96_053189 [Rhipicephalus microplus]
MITGRGGYFKEEYTKKAVCLRRLHKSVEKNLEWFPRMRAMSLAADEADGEQNEMRTLQNQLEDTQRLVTTLSRQLAELRDQMTEQRKHKQRLGLLAHPNSVPLAATASLSVH